MQAVRKDFIPVKSLYGQLTQRGQAAIVRSSEIADRALTREICRVISKLIRQVTTIYLAMSPSVCYNFKWSAKPKIVTVKGARYVEKNR